MDRVERLPRIEPDVGNLPAVLRRERPSRVPLFELPTDREVQTSLLEESAVVWHRDAPADERMYAIRQTIGLHRRLGYDTIRLRAGIPFKFEKAQTSDTAGCFMTCSTPGRTRITSSRYGVATTWGLRRPPW